MKRLASFLTICALAGVIGCAPKNQPAGGADSTKMSAASDVDANKAANKKFYDLYNAKDFDHMGDVVAADFVDHNPDPMQGPGLAGIIASFKEFQKGFPDFKFEVVKMIGEGDMVSTVTRVTGTNTGEMMGMPPNNKKFDVTAIDVVRFKNGKGVERWGLYDSRAMMMQMGMMPPPPPEMKKRMMPPPPAKK
jgi:steroid delta-isomerase-like uncharacterized protein